MTPSEFWEGDVYLVEAYRRAYVLKLKQQNRLNYEEGLYQFHAVSIALSNFHLDGKHHKTNNYLEKPFDLYMTQEEVDEIEKKKAEEEKQRLVAYLTALQKSWENKKKKGTENGTQN